MSDRFSPVPGIESVQNMQKEYQLYKQPSREEQLAEIKVRLEAKNAVYKKMKLNHMQSNQEAQHELRHKFQSSLNKLSSLETRHVGVKEARQIIERNASSECLKVFLGSLGEIKKMKSPIAREQEVLLIGWVANVYRERIEEDGMKTVNKMIEMILDFFNDLNRQVHEAAATALCEVYEYCIPKENVDVILGTLYDPLEIAMTSGVNTKSQQAAALSMFKWIQLLISHEETEIAYMIYPRTLLIFCKLRAEFPDLISALGALIDHCGIDALLPSLLSVIKKTLQYIQYIGPNSHLYKIEACKLLSCLGKHLQNMADLVLEPFHTEVLLTLQDTKTDKLASVQNAARQAYNDWKVLEGLQKEIEEKKMQQDPIPAEEIVKYRTGVRDFKNYDNPSVSPERVGPNNFKAIRELAKRNKQLQENSQKQNPWGVSKSKFLEKGSGNHFETEKVPEVPKRPQTAVNKRNIENVSNFIVPRDGVNKHIMEVIQRSSVEAIPKYKGDMEIVKEMEPSRHKKNEYQSPVFKENSDSDVDFEDVPKSVFSNARQMKNQSDIVVLPQKPPQPKHQPDIVVPLKQQSDMSLFTENIKNTFLAMQKTMDRGFNAIEQRLYSLDQRMDEAYDRLEVVSEPKIESLADMRRSFVHPPLKNDVESQVKAKHPEKLNINSIETQTIPVLSPKETQTAALSKPPSSSRLEKPIIIKPNVEKSEEIDALSKIWIDVLHDLSIGKVEDAYIKVLNSGDDIYLLRLMHKTGTCLSKMSSGACKRILGRLGMILNSGFLEGIGVDWMDEAIKENMVSSLNDDDKQSLSDAMERISQLPGEEAISASNILNSLSYL